MAAGDVGKIVGLLADAADGDTVYRDVYLRQARGHLSQELPESAYRELATLQARVNGLLDESRAAAFRRDWARVAQLAGEAETARATLAARGVIAEIAKRVYDARSVALDPFSPGLPGMATSRQREQALLADMVERLRSLSTVDPSLASFYESRRAYFTGLAAAARGDEAAATSSDAGLERRAFEAAQRGDTARLRDLARELTQERRPAGSAGDGAWAAYECPVKLDVAFPEDAVTRARALGFAQVRTAPLLDVPALRELIYSHVWQPGPPDDDREEEGVARAQKLIAAEKFPREFAEHLKVLAGQFVMHTFVNSGGARYLPSAASEVTLIEDFPEDDATDAKSELLHALGLGRRHGLARVEIEAALARDGAIVLSERLRLDPLEFRLVCVPYDLYTRCGESRGWGQGERYTHFDGYQAMRTGRLRALAGGHSRFGGLLDLVSINATDARENVLARFAVVRRARMVARWA